MTRLAPILVHAVSRNALAAFLVLVLAGCEVRYVETDLRVVDVRTGWYDAGITEGGENKLVPSISLRLENVSDRPIDGVQINAVFKRVGDDLAWGEHFVRAIESETPLAPGAMTEPIVLRSQLGYTGSQGRLQMLQNREFVDGRVEIFGRHGRRTWVEIHEAQIERQLLTE
jgi:hypothetical protein